MKKLFLSVIIAASLFSCTTDNRSPEQVRADEENSGFLTVYNIQTLPEYFLIDRGNNLISRSQQIQDLEKAIVNLL